MNEYRESRIKAIGLKAGCFQRLVNCLSRKWLTVLIPSIISLAIVIIYIFFKEWYNTILEWRIFQIFACRSSPLYLHPSAFASTVTAGGFAGILFTWLLQSLKFPDSGVEIGSVINSKYPALFFNVVSLTVSSSICIYIGNVAGPLRRDRMIPVLLLNGLNILWQLTYIVAMCWGFLFYQEKRKRNVYAYLRNRIEQRWKLFHYETWKTPDVNALIGDLSCCSTWCLDNPFQWFFHMWQLRLEDPANPEQLVRWGEDSLELFDEIYRTLDGNGMLEMIGCIVYAFSMDCSAVWLAPSIKDRITARASAIINKYIRYHYYKHDGRHLDKRDHHTAPDKGDESYARCYLDESVNKYLYLLSIWAKRCYDLSQGGEYDRYDQVIRTFYRGIIHTFNIYRNLSRPRKWLHLIRMSNGFCIDTCQVARAAYAAMFSCVSSLLIYQEDNAAGGGGYALKVVTEKYMAQLSKAHYVRKWHQFNRKDKFIKIGRFMEYMHMYAPPYRDDLYDDLYKELSDFFYTYD